MSFRDLGLFLQSVVRNGVGLVMGGAVFMLLMFWERYSRTPIPPLLYWPTVALSFLLATFMSWKAEKVRADKAESELARISSLDATSLARVPTDEEFWLLCLIQRYGAHRELIPSRIGGAANALFLGKVPTADTWLSVLTNDAAKRGLLDMSESRGITKYTIPASIEAAVGAHRRNGRQIVVPKESLSDARSGGPISLDV